MARMAFAFCHRNMATQCGFPGWTFAAMIKSCFLQWSGVIQAFSTGSSFMPELNFLKATPMQHLFCLGNLRKASLRKVSFSYSLSLARKSPHHCSSRSPRADHRQPCPCSIVIPNSFPGTSLVTQMFSWRPFPLCFLLFSVSSHGHPSVLNTSLEKDPLS